MRAGGLVVVEVRGQDAAQVALVEVHDVIQTFAANRIDHALDEGVLPRGAWRRDDFSDAHRFDPIAEVGPIRCISIAQQIARSGVPGNASVTWRESQAAVGCSVTAVRTMFLRLCARMIT